MTYIEKVFIDTPNCLCGKQENAYHFSLSLKIIPLSDMFCLINYLPYLVYFLSTQILYFRVRNT